MNVFTRTTIKTLKKNKMRTLVTIIGIILAAAMLTAVTTFISSLQHYMIESVILQAGNWHGAVYELSGQQAGEIRKSDEVEESETFQEIGYAVLPGVKEEEMSTRRAPYLFVLGMEADQSLLPLRLRTGRMPENGSELVVSSTAMSIGKADIALGDTLTLEIGRRFTKDEEHGELTLYNPIIREEVEEGSLEAPMLAEELVPEMTRTYTVVGIVESPGFLDSNSSAYYAITIGDKNPLEGSRFACYYRLHKSSDIYRFTDEHMAGSSYATYNSELLRYQGTSSNRPFMQMLYGLAAILILLIMTGGISLVYNSFAISVSDRTRQFGILASAGATPKQLRGMVLREALLVSAVGIPVGIVSGIGGIGVTLHFTGNAFYYIYASAGKMHLHVSWPAVVIAGATALMTVLISAWIPSRRAAKVSPMEAIRQSGDIRVPKKVARKGKLAYRFFGLEGMIAGKHFSRSKRQYRTTIFSLFISIVLFISASSFSTYLKSSVGTVQSTPEYDISVYIEEGENKGEAKRLLEETGNISGVDRVLYVGGSNMDVYLDPEQVTEDYREILNDDMAGYGNMEGRRQEDGRLVLYDSRILVLTDGDYEEYVKELGLSKEEYPVSGDSKVIALNQLQGYISEQQRYRLFDILKAPGQEIEMMLTDYEALTKAQERTGMDQKREDFQIPVNVTVGVFAERAPMNLYGEWGGGFSVILSESMFDSLVGSNALDLRSIQLYIQAENHQQVAERLEELSLDGSFDSYFFVMNEAEGRQTRKNLMMTMDVFSYGFITLISLIAVANVFNTISTGVLLRRKEFAVLSSVGMTPGGLRRMLNYECVLYGCKALLYGLPVSIFVTWQIYRVVERSMDTGFYVPVTSILIAVCSVFLVVFATMMYARNRIKGENIIDSIRQESL